MNGAVSRHGGEAAAAGMAVWRHRRGRIAYRDAAGADVGREWFDLLPLPDGHLLRALCVMDAEALVRDVSLRLDSTWRPCDGWSRVVRHGQGDDALWFRCGDDTVVVESRLAGEDRQAAGLTVPGGLPYLGLHPLQGDALIAMARGRAAPGEFRPITAMTNSISPNGDADPGARTLTIEAAFIGRVSLEVAAGPFQADHFQLRWQADWPVADLWVRADDCLFLRLVWPLAAGAYELVSYEEL